MEFKKVHARYKGEGDTEGFLPGWGYDLQIRRHNGQVTIRRDGLAQDWKTVSQLDFQREWAVMKKKQ